MNQQPISHDEAIRRALYFEILEYGALRDSLRIELNHTNGIRWIARASLKRRIAAITREQSRAHGQYHMINARIYNGKSREMWSSV